MARQCAVWTCRSGWVTLRTHGVAGSGASGRPSGKAGGEKEFFLIQPFDFPERVIGTDPEYFGRCSFERVPNYQELFPPEVLNEYVRCFCDPATIHATCEDYRAGASIDLVYDDEDLARGHKVTCPLLALWSADRYVGRTYDVLEVWREYATDVRGHSLPCGHYIPEELPDETYTALTAFFLEG